MLVLAGLLVVADVDLRRHDAAQSFDQQFFHRTLPNALDYPGMRYLGIGEVIVADLLVAIPGLILALLQPQTQQKSSSLFGPGAPPS